MCGTEANKQTAFRPIQTSPRVHAAGRGQSRRHTSLITQETRPLNFSFDPPIHNIPLEHRSVGLRCYAAGFKRALSQCVSGRQLQDAIEEVDRVTNRTVGSMDLVKPIDGGGGKSGGGLLGLVGEGGV